MKKIILWVLTALMLFSLTAVSAEAQKEITVPEVTTLRQQPIPDNAAMTFLKNMGVGWNLGNTFDATRDNWKGNDLTIETYWQGAKTSQELIDLLVASGYRTIRIPVSWHNHVSGEDFVINTPWLDRVQEVVDYAYGRGMYVILNTHHDVYPAYYYPSSQYTETSDRYIRCIWTQVAARFADYDEHLIFESMNEPRLKDTPNEWSFDTNSPACRDAAERINAMNQIFVDTVRAAGGRNADRYLMVPAYDANPNYATNSYFRLPEDTADNRMIVSAHAYTPYNFALNDKGDTAFSMTNSAQTGEINRFMNGLYNKYIVNGIPVVIGEFGARDKGGNLQSRVDFAAYYTAAASIRNIPCCWWDNHAFRGNGELFGVIDRNTCTVVYPEIVEAMIKNSGYDSRPAQP